MGQLQSPSIILFPVLGFCCGALFPSHHWLISEGRNKNAACPTCVVHVQSLTHFYQNEAILFKWRMRGRQSYVLVQRKRECCIFFLTSWVSGFCFLAHWGCLPTHAGWKVLAHIAFFAHWVQQWREVSGGGGGVPLHNIASSQENLPPKLFQSPSTYVATLPKAQKCHGGI